MAESARDGTICTFYSYKGGVGRTQALANVALLLARWGYRVLCVDWDLEAPGLHLYFARYLEGRRAAGVVELMAAYGAGARPLWADHVIALDVPGPGSVSLMPAGHLDDGYPQRMQALDWERLFSQDGLGIAIEGLRDELRGSYDYVLVDSRTGITDIGGICAVQLPDVLVALFTASHQSLDGVLDVAERASAQRQRLPFERGLVPVLPVITRFEATVEVQLAQDWMRRFEQRLGGVLSTWSHRDVPLAELLPLIRVPYVAHWSFGEQLPVVDEGTSDPSGIGHAFETLAALLANRLEHSEVLVANRRSYVEAASTRLVGDEFEFDAYVAAAGARDYGSALADAMRAAGLRVLADADVSPGERIDVAVRGHVARARDMVVVLGDEPAAWLESEARGFLVASATEETSRLLVPVIRGSAAGIPAWARNLVYVDARSAPFEQIAISVVLAIQSNLVQVRRERLGDDHPRTLEALRNFVSTLVRKQDWSAAVELQELVLASLERTGAAPSEIAAATATMADLLRRAGRYAESLELAERLLGQVQDSAGASSVEVADALHEIGKTSDALGRLVQARDALEHAVAIRRGELGDEHPDTLVAESDLALAELELGEHDRAHRRIERVIEAQRRTLGEDHQDTLTSLTRRARTLFALGELDAAKRAATSVLERQRKVLGDEDYRTLSSVDSLAAILHRMGDLDRARELEERALEIRRRRLGEEHPETLSAMGNLAATFYAEGDLARAKEIEAHVLETRKRVLGPEHPATLVTQSNLAETLHDLGDFSASLELQERTLAARRRVLGEEHPGTLLSLGSVSRTLARVDRLDEAIETGERVVAARSRVLGDEHPDTLTALGNLGTLLHQAGELERARGLGEAVLETRRRVLGSQHPDTLLAMRNLAGVLLDQRDLAGARALAEEVVACYGRQLGEEQPSTLAAMYELAVVLHAQGELAAARDLHARAREGRARVLGPEDPATLWSTIQLAETLRDLGEQEGADGLLRGLARREG